MDICCEALGSFFDFRPSDLIDEIAAEAKGKLRLTVRAISRQWNETIKEITDNLSAKLGEPIQSLKSDLNEPNESLNTVKMAFVIFCCVCVLLLILRYAIRAIHDCYITRLEMKRNDEESGCWPCCFVRREPKDPSKIQEIIDKYETMDEEAKSRPIKTKL